MRATTRAAAVLAGGLGLIHPHAVSHATLPPKPAHVRHHPASQPASTPASQPQETEHEQALRAYRATQRGPYDEAIARAAERWGIDPFLMRGLFQHESKMDPAADNERSSARGIAQFVPSGAAAVGRLQRARGVKRPFSYAKALDWREAIPAAAELLDHLRGACSVVGFGIEYVLAAYNSGRCAARVPRFVSAVLRYANQYRLEAALPPLPIPQRWWKRERREARNAPES